MTDKTTETETEDSDQAQHDLWLDRFDRWEAMTDREREDEIRRAI